MRNEYRLTRNHFTFRIWLVTLAISFLMPMLTSCQNVNEKWDPLHISTQEIDAAELARLIVDSLVSEDMESDYRSIPATQRDDMSYSQYAEYIDLLQNLCPTICNVESFRFLSTDESSTLLAEMANGLSPDYADLVLQSIPFEITFERNSEGIETAILYLQTDENGVPFISTRWVNRLSELVNYSIHYFEAMNGDNLDAIQSLVCTNQSSFTFPERILTQKASAIYDFYRLNVKSSVEQYRVTVLNAKQVCVTQPEVMDESNASYESRIVSFTYSDSDTIIVSDPMVSSLRSSDLYLYYNGARCLRIGETATSLQLISLFGEPVSTSFGPQLYFEDTEEGEHIIYRNIVIKYPTFQLTVRGVENKDGSWDGRLIRFRIFTTGTETSLGAYFTNSSDIFDVLYRYPFADETDYLITNEIEGANYTLEVHFKPVEADGGVSGNIDSYILTLDDEFNI